MINKVRERRKALKLTQEDLSRLSGVSRGTIVSLEKGKADNVLYSTMQSLASAMSTTVKEIFFDQSVQNVEHGDE